MDNQLMILVTGAPATGKTNLSKDLSKRFNIPVLNKDELKELLFDNLGIKDKEWAVQLGVTSFELTYFFIEKLLQTGQSFIVEGNFDNRYSTESFLKIKSKYNYRTLQIYCHTQPEVLYERYQIRDASGDRHPGHTPLDSNFDAYKKFLEKEVFRLNLPESINVEIDTTNFDAVDFDKIYDEVENNLNP